MFGLLADYYESRSMFGVGVAKAQWKRPVAKTRQLKSGATKRK